LVEWKRNVRLSGADGSPVTAIGDLPNASRAAKHRMLAAASRASN
jgi:hypothetical protein